jgi:ABC-type multidrug transport system ATPase subunit
MKGDRMNTIEAHDLRKSYGDVEAVRGVSFEVAHGEVFVLLGPNGAGKTTTTEILEGYRARSGGDVRVLGFDPEQGGRAFHERIGIVLQQTGVEQYLTVGEVLAMYGSYYPRRRPAAELLGLVGLEGKLDTRVHELSGGQRRRLDLALALVGDPDLLFLDEPTTGFDPSARRRAWSTIAGLCRLGKTVVLTTHFMDEAEALADRVAVLRDGSIVAVGTPGELGGRDAAPTEIRFSLPPGVEPADLPGLGDADVSRNGGDAVVVSTRDGLAAVHRLSGWALERGLALPGFTVTQPSLEDVYLQLTADDHEEARR